MMQLWTDGKVKFLVYAGTPPRTAALNRGISGMVTCVPLPAPQPVRRTACGACGSIYDASHTHCMACGTSKHTMPDSVISALAEAECMLSSGQLDYL